MMRNRQARMALVAATVLALPGTAAAKSSVQLSERSVLVVTVRLGDICPHDTGPASPDCAPKLLPGAPVSLVDANGRAVSTRRSGADGTLRFLARAGSYTLVARPLSSARITPKPVLVTLSRGMKRSLVLTYFTGIQ